VVRVSALWAVDGTDIDWREDAGVALLRGADGSGARDGGGCDRDFGGGFGGVAAERVADRQTSLRTSSLEAYVIEHFLVWIIKNDVSCCRVAVDCNHLRKHNFHG
jgi:hypothetical protein